KDGMEWIVRVDTDNNTDLVTVCTDERSKGKERDGVDKGLHEHGVELVTGKTREHEAGMLWHGRILIGTSPREGLVNVRDRDYLAHDVRHVATQIGIAAASRTPMVLERHQRRQRAQSLGLHQDLGAQRRVRLNELSLTLGEGPRLFHDVEWDSGLADVVEDRCFHERRHGSLVEAQLPAEQEAQYCNVHGV